MAFFRNPPEADKSRRLPCLPNGMFLKFLFHRGEMQSLFLWGQSSKSLVPARGQDVQLFDFPSGA
jgi:hypothetical protein